MNFYNGEDFVGAKKTERNLQNKRWKIWIKYTDFIIRRELFYWAWNFEGKVWEIRTNDKGVEN